MHRAPPLGFEPTASLADWYGLKSLPEIFPARILVRAQEIVAT